ncbi:hypothetical protein [Paradesulfitobacterium ferrireducens]|uniref:hypothetical protein n=1 Tax=Paradesulfitobacterium ferrireducens TaxID=2816476 RepID=UPI001A8FA82B|nr:hypothetical protein [Paradesulfitobacterium ferrireducens]
MSIHARLLCRCGYEHVDESFIEYRRDAISNQIKLFCRKCGKRLFTEYITTSSREFRKIFLDTQTKFEEQKSSDRN